jgi:hypothetical protein
VVLQVPDEVEVRKVDLAIELQILSFHVARRHGESNSAHGRVNRAAATRVNGRVTGSELVSGDFVGDVAARASGVMPR